MKKFLLIATFGVALLAGPSIASADDAAAGAAAGAGVGV